MTSTETAPAAANWRQLLDDWDRQQSRYLSRREERFGVALDAIGLLLGETLDEGFTVLDVGCGPGSFAERLLARFPTARVVAVDMDPVLLAVGRGALGDADGRLSWVDADVRERGWTDRLPVTRVDAVVSSTALHWLSAAQLAATYRRLGLLVRDGGVLVNADTMPYDRSATVLTRLAADAERDRQSAADREALPEWDAWWESALAAGELAGAGRERDRRATGRDPAEDDHEPGAPLTGLRMHVAALLEAGFEQAGTIWQDHDDRVLLAVR